jgi:hypothetical protein
MCVDCVLVSPRIAQADPVDELLLEVNLSHLCCQHILVLRHQPLLHLCHWCLLRRPLLWCLLHHSPSTSASWHTTIGREELRGTLIGSPTLTANSASSVCCGGVTGCAADQQTVGVAEV